MNISSRWTIVILVALPILFGMAVCILAYLSSMASTHLEEEIRHIEEKGDSLVLEDLFPPVPDEENGAIPYEEAMAVLTEPSPDESRALNTLERDHMNATPEVVLVCEQWLEKNRTCMALLQEGMARRFFRLNLDYSNPITLELPSLAHYRHFLHLFTTRAFLHARAGRPEKSFQACCQAIRLSKIMSKSPLMISYMIYIACELNALDCLEKLLERFEPSAEDRHILLAAITDQNPFEAYGRALEEERCYGNTLFEILRGRQALPSRDGNDRRRAGFGQPSRYPDFVLRLDQARYLEEMSRMLEEVHHPHPATNGTWNSGEVKNNLPWYCIMTECSLLAHELVLRNAGALSARADLARLALALIHHRAKHGNLPDTLEELDPMIVNPKPLDPFTAKPFHYRRQPGGGFLLYSVGANGEDDQGRAMPSSETMEGDIVWTWAPASTSSSF